MIWYWSPTQEQVNQSGRVTLIAQRWSTNQSFMHWAFINIQVDALRNTRWCIASVPWSISTLQCNAPGGPIYLGWLTLRKMIIKCRSFKCSDSTPQPSFDLGWGSCRWWLVAREEEASAQQSLQHKTTCLPTLASCLLLMQLLLVTALWKKRRLWIGVLRLPATSFFCHFSVPRCEYEYARGPSSTAAPSQEVGNRCLLSFTNFKGPTNSVLFWLEPPPRGLGTS